MTRFTACLLAALLACAPHVHADDDKDAPLRLEVGGGSEWSLDDHDHSIGPALGVEFEGFKDLEIEAGTSALRSHGRVEWDTDFSVKKEVVLSPTLEFEAGLGPEWNHSTGKNGSDSAGAELEAELVYWTSASHRFGWYLEPGYGYDFGKEREASLSLGLGLTVAVP